MLEKSNESIGHYLGSNVVKWVQLGSRDWKSHLGNDPMGLKQQPKLNHWGNQSYLEDYGVSSL